LIRFAVIKFIIFKFKIVSIDFKSSKFISENSTVILLTENIDIDFDLIKILYIVTIEFLLYLLQILQSFSNIDKSLLSTESNIKDISIIDIVFTINLYRLQTSDISIFKFYYLTKIYSFDYSFCLFYILKFLSRNQSSKLLFYSIQLYCLQLYQLYCLQLYQIYCLQLYQLYCIQIYQLR